MTANRASVTLALTAALALAGQPALARGAQRGGGHPGGGGRPGGSHAVPRGGGYVGGGAQARHPRAGTGGYSYRPYYGGHYRPYHGGHYGYYPYGRSSFYFGASLYYGWPYYGSGWWPYGRAGYYSPGYYAPYYGYRYDAPEAPPASDTGRPYASNRDTGRVRLEVRPDDASVYVDDEFWGNGRETKFLTLRSGRHAIELVRPGFEIARREVEVVRGETSDVLVELQRP